MTNLIKQKISSKNVLKQTKISDFSDAVYALSKNELKMMWLGRNTRVLGGGLPLRWGFCYLGGGGGGWGAVEPHRKPWSSK